MYAMDHTTHFEHRNESLPARRFLRRVDTTCSATSARSDTDREQTEATPWPLPEFAD